MAIQLRKKKIRWEIFKIMNPNTKSFECKKKNNENGYNVDLFGSFPWTIVCKLFAMKNHFLMQKFKTAHDMITTHHENFFLSYLLNFALNDLGTHPTSFFMHLFLLFLTYSFCLTNYSFGCLPVDSFSHLFI